MTGFSISMDLVPKQPDAEHLSSTHASTAEQRLKFFIAGCDGSCSGHDGKCNTGATRHSYGSGTGSIYFPT